MENMIVDRVRQGNHDTAASTQNGSKKMAYKVDDIQSILSISRPTAYKLVNSGAFPVVKVGQQIRIPAKSFDAWLNGGASV